MAEELDESILNIKDNIEDFRAAGKIAAKIREESKRLIMVGEPLLDIAETIENMIEKEGAKPAFPVNLSKNSIAAHYTPSIDDTTVVEETDIIKVDIGVSVNGAIGDTAYTIDLSEKNKQLVDAAEEALSEVIKAIKPGVKIGDLGAITEGIAKKYGFKPISNLSGHMIKTGLLHAGIDIPNIKTDDDYIIKEGEIYAIEPFITNGAGYVEDAEEVGIFSFYGPGSTTMRQSKKILEHIIKEYRLLPFAERWVMRKFNSKILVNAALRELLEAQIITGYPVLKDAGNGLVSQAEHTVLVTTDGCEILTK
ncbi:MAG: type II methionyl aminopeptidase [Candidatus Bilamarchaeaceae archaeon]